MKLLFLPLLLCALLVGCATTPVAPPKPKDNTPTVVVPGVQRTYTIRQLDANGRTVATYSTKEFKESFSPNTLTFVDERGVLRRVEGSYDVFLD